MEEERITRFSILLIMNCKKYTKKALYQKMTWLKSFDKCNDDKCNDDYNSLQYYHVIGEEDMKCDFKFDNDSKILWIKVADDYNSLPKKVIKAYEAVNKTFNYQYIFKTDDDQILVNPNFFSILRNILTKSECAPESPMPTIQKTLSQIHYGGFIIDVKQNYLSQYNKIHPELPAKLPILQTKYCSGRFYFLSKVAIQNLLTKKQLIFREYLEDYAIGYHLDPRLKTNMLRLMTNKFFTDIELSDFPKMISQGNI